MISPTQPRIGFCCKFVPPDGDKQQTKLMNLTSTTIAALSRRDRNAAFEKLLAIVRHNLAALERQLLWVAARPPLERMFRILSGVLPAYTHEVGRALYAEPLMRRTVELGLAQAGEVARGAGVRLSMHPGQFCILATAGAAALKNAVDELDYHAEILGLMGLAGDWHPMGAHINIHGGARAAGIEGFQHGLRQVSRAARALVTVENDENAFGLDDLLPLADELPIVVDFHHHWIHSAGEYLPADDPRVAIVAASWRGVRPVTHISAPREDLPAPLPAGQLPDFADLVARGIPRRDLYAHSDGMWNDALNDWLVTHLAWSDVEVEAKLKNLAAARLAARVGPRLAPVFAG